jgi:cell wall-associated NlpC family hydrolase
MFEDLIGKPFETGARGPNKFDCYGLCIEVYKRLGKEVEDYGFLDTEKAKEISNLFDEKRENFVKIDKPQPFCLVALMIVRPYVSHVGVVLEDCRRFIHISYRRNVCIEYLDSDRWKNRIDGYWRYAEN